MSHTQKKNWIKSDISWKTVRKTNHNKLTILITLKVQVQNKMWNRLGRRLCGRQPNRLLTWTMYPTSILWMFITFCTVSPNVRAVNHWIISVDGKIQPKVSHFRFKTVTGGRCIYLDSSSALDWLAILSAPTERPGCIFTPKRIPPTNNFTQC